MKTKTNKKKISNFHDSSCANFLIRGCIRNIEFKKDHNMIVLHVITQKKFDMKVYNRSWFVVVSHANIQMDPTEMDISEGDIVELAGEMDVYRTRGGQFRTSYHVERYEVLGSVYNQ